jgi:endonuclease/exonuclease/phosphatase family metal-dependent hydrolase
MTFNIRLDHADDSLNNWQYRKDIAAQAIKNYDVDIVGTQEVLPNQMQDLRERLSEYTALGVGREDGANKGEYSALFYKKDKFKEIKSGTFWLSETPEKPGSMGWDAACTRVATWALLEDITTSKRFFAINTHLDHIGQKARINGVSLILKKAHAIAGGLSVILTGDFNSEPTSDVIQHVISNKIPNHLVNSRDIAITKNDALGTFHDFGRLPENKREYIDYIFVSKGTKVLEYKVAEEKMNNIFLSDHNPVFAKIVIK